MTTVSGDTAPMATMPRIGDPAPAFRAKTTQGDINFPADYAGKWVILRTRRRRTRHHRGAHF